MNDLRLELRFKNARLFELIEERFRVERGGRYGCCSLAAKTIGIDKQTMNGFLTLRNSPWAWGGRWEKGEKEYLRPAAQKIADFFSVDPYELFPINLYRLKIPRLLTKLVDSERYISLSEARAQKLLPTSTEMNLEDVASNDELSNRLDGVLKTLTPREELVIKMRFGLEDGEERLLDECAERIGVSRERARQIEAKALRKMRKPSRAKPLMPFLAESR